jgi:hypothetical protein
MRIADASAGLSVRTVTHGGAPAAVASGCGRWVLLQYVQYQIYFCDMQMKHLQRTFKTVETLANIHLKHLQDT